MYPEHNPYFGQMTDKERRSLYEWVYNASPQTVVEVGTGTGGGASFYIASALRELGGDRKLYTCDPGNSPSNEFLEEFKNIVVYKPILSHDLIAEIPEDREIGYIFFDGPEDPSVAMKDIEVLEKRIKPGTYFSMHDWETEKRGFDGGVSVKAAAIRPYMEQSDKWKHIESLSGLIPNEEGRYDSVGLCLYEYV